MRPDELESQIAGISTLDEPVRRDLYLYVAEREAAVGRDEAAEAVGVSRALAAFHLDKLVEAGLLEVEFRRLTGRSGPGAGRPAKLYRRSARQLDLTLPQRRYELAARLFAEALDSGDPLEQVARRVGAAWGRDARGEAGDAAPPRRLLAAIKEALAERGFEPATGPDGEIRLRNCPFHSLAQEHRSLVCGMNVALLSGLLTGLDLSSLTAVLDPHPGFCCVVVRPGVASPDPRP